MHLEVLLYRPRRHGEVAQAAQQARPLRRGEDGVALSPQQRHKPEGLGVERVAARPEPTSASPGPGAGQGGVLAGGFGHRRGFQLPGADLVGLGRAEREHSLGTTVEELHFSRGPDVAHARERYIHIISYIQAQVVCFIHDYDSDGAGAQHGAGVSSFVSTRGYCKGVARSGVACPALPFRGEAEYFTTFPL